MVCNSVTAARPAMVVRLTVMPASPATRAGFWLFYSAGNPA